MGKLLPISKRDKRTKGVSLTIGVDGRMYLSSGLRDILKHEGKRSYFLYYDAECQRIGISSKCPDENIEPFTFNKSGEGRVVEFVEDCEIQIPGKPLLWLYESKEGDILVFYLKGRKVTSFKQDKNGNLERISYNPELLKGE